MLETDFLAVLQKDIMHLALSEEDLVVYKTTQLCYKKIS